MIFRLICIKAIISSIREFFGSSQLSQFMDQPNPLAELTHVISDAKEKYAIEGVTYSGGEPTLQQNLPELTVAIQNMGLGVIAFTGHLYEDAADALFGCDMVLDGSYQAGNPELSRRLLGSTNQRILCLTDRYRNQLTWFEGERSVEWNVNDVLFANGDYLW